MNCSIVCRKSRHTHQMRRQCVNDVHPSSLPASTGFALRGFSIRAVRFHGMNPIFLPRKNHAKRDELLNQIRKGSKWNH